MAAIHKKAGVAVVAATAAAWKPSMLEFAFTAIIQHPDQIKDLAIIVVVGVIVYFTNKNGDGTTPPPTAEDSIPAAAPEAAPISASIVEACEEAVV